MGAIPQIKMTSQTGELVLHSKETVLVAEDEPLVSNLVSHVLLAQGYHVLLAANGAEALPVAGQHKEGPIDLLVTDVVLPQLGGIELAHRLRAMYPDIKVLFISGYDRNDPDVINLQDLLAFGSEFLEKPFTPNTLAVKIREVLDKVE